MSETIRITGGPEDTNQVNKRTDERNKGVIFKGVILSMLRH